MGDSAFMGGRQSLRDLMTPVERAADFQLALLQALAQRRSLEQLHDRVESAAVGPEVMNGKDVRVRERRDGARFGCESAATARASRSNRARASSVCAVVAIRTLTATSRCRR